MKPIYQIGILFYVLTLAGMTSLLAQEEVFLAPLIEINPNGELTVLKGFCKNNTDAPLLLNYQLKVEHKGIAGKNNTAQKGEFDILPKQKKLLATSVLNISPNDYLKVTLALFSGKEMMTIDSLLIKPQKKAPPKALLQLAEKLSQQEEKRPPATPSPKQKPKTTNKPSPPLRPTDRVTLAKENIGIDGLVIDDTRTKMAHDFYDLFYRKWIAPEGVADFIIYIKELPARGRIARVALVVNDDQVIQRVLSPRADLLEQQVNICINALARHLRNKENVKEQLGSEDAMGSGIF